MTKFLSLVKLFFKQQFRSKPSSGKKKKGGTILLFVLLGIIFVPMLIMLAVQMYGIGGLVGANQGVVAFLILGGQALVLLLGISSLIVGVFMPRDADKLMYLPIKSSTIFLAKLTVAYINEVLTTAVTILFLLLPYGIGANVSFGYYLMLVPSLLLIPLLPILLGTLIAMPISLLLTKVGKNGIAKTLLTTLFFLTFMALYLVAMSYVTKLEASQPDGELTAEQLLQMLQSIVLSVGSKMVYVHTNYLLAGSMIATNFVSWLANFSLSILEFCALGGLTFLVAKPFYKHMLLSQTEGIGGKLSKGKVTYQTKKSSVIKKLVLTDFKRTIRDSQMGFQCFAGLVMMPLIVVVLALGFNGDGQSGSLADMSKTFEYQLIAPLGFIAYLTLLGISSNVLGLFPISRENKSFYILKSLPISFGKILTAKVLLATVFMLAIDLLVAILCVFLLGIKWYFALAMLVLLAFLGFGSMCITTYYDLKHPKFGWSNFNQSLKNSKNSYVAMLVGVLCMLAIALVGVPFVLLYFATSNLLFVILLWVLLIIVGALFAFVAYRSMVTRAQTLFDKIEA